jgi:hypothetical protein
MRREQSPLLEPLAVLLSDYSGSSAFQSLLLTAVPTGCRLDQLPSFAVARAFARRGLEVTAMPSRNRPRHNSNSVLSFLICLGERGGWTPSPNEMSANSGRE